MKRGITINFSNRTLYTLIAVFSLLIISGIVIATLNPTIPNPGHAVADLQKCGNGETLVMASGAWTCGAGGSLTCRIINTSKTTSPYQATVTCNADEVLTGGACRDNGGGTDIITASMGHYISGNSYTCRADQGIRITAVCCKGILTP